jgi:hypothetical protein
MAHPVGHNEDARETLIRATQRAPRLGTFHRRKFQTGGKKMIFTIGFNKTDGENTIGKNQLCSALKEKAVKGYYCDLVSYY